MSKKNTASVRDMFPEIQSAVKPVILSHAYRISRALGIPTDDAIQEVSLALYRAMENYDYNRSRGGLVAFADVILRNSAMSIIGGANAAMRVPHVVTMDGGERKVLKMPRLASLDTLLSEDGGEPSSEWDGPEAVVASRQLQESRAKLYMRLVNSLNSREQAIFKCLTSPPESLLLHAKNMRAQRKYVVGEDDDITHGDIAGYLGIGTNAVDYSAYRIRLRLTELAEKEFPELVAGHLESGAWPMIHVCRASRPAFKFIARTIRDRGLDPRPSEPQRDIEVNGQWGREIHKYEWGVVMILRNGDKYRTLVIEGKLNPLTGGVSGVDGTWKCVGDVVLWYTDLVKGLKKCP